MKNRTQEKNKWIAENLDRISLTVPKGQKELVQAHATINHKSLNSYINHAIEEAMEQDRLLIERKDDLTGHARAYKDVFCKG